MRLNCVVVIFRGGREFHSWRNDCTPRQVQRLLRDLERAFLRGLCDSYVVLYSGEAVTDRTKGGARDVVGHQLV